tara:strand:+ start:1144 stop:1446 length:303 start_codon:yes stop_codon:yes gene_type:complete
MERRNDVWTNGPEVHYKANPGWLFAFTGTGNNYAHDHTAMLFHAAGQSTNELRNLVAYPQCPFNNDADCYKLKIYVERTNDQCVDGIHVYTGSSLKNISR